MAALLCPVCMNVEGYHDTNIHMSGLTFTMHVDWAMNVDPLSL